MIEVIVLNEHDIELIVAGLVSLAAGGFFGWLKGFGDGLNSAVKELEK